MAKDFFLFISAPSFVIRSNARWLWLTLLVIILDYLTKQWALDVLSLHLPEPVFPSLNMTLMYNTGAAFSFLADADGWQRWFFVGLALIISLVIIVWLLRLPANSRWLAVALSLVLGGALGNVWDRMTLGYVVDFIDVYYQNWHWPAFNIADSAISIGAVMLVLDAFLQKDEESNK